ncbi:GNAT family N-acetyltransferase [Oligoflexia bacterium]|nr:GNAT family N-acetyltransferase [Oligoflexia bacterium]
MSVHVTKSIEYLKSCELAWDDLALAALEPNVFYEAWALLPALEHLANEAVEIVLVWSKDKQNLIGLFPLVSRYCYRRAPVSYYSFWNHIHCFLCTPLVRSGCEHECFEQFFSWLNAERSSYLLELPCLRSDGPFYKALNAYLKDTGHLIDQVENHERALLQSKHDPDAYFEAELPRKLRKDIRRKQRRLAELGEVSVRSLSEESDLDAWLDCFFTLEQSGWKGKGATAIACRANEMRYYQHIAENAHARGCLAMTMLTLNDAPIAMNFSLLSGRACFAIKIAYDEQYSKCSPGVLLERENIARILSDPSITFVDSCATSGHPMLDEMWNAKRQIATFGVSKQGFFSRSIITAIPFLKRLCSKQEGK